MKTSHVIYFENCRAIEKRLEPESVDLVVTSPPYPMIEMWDLMFCQQNPRIETALKNQDGTTAFELMHQILDEKWSLIYRVLKPDRFACVNIGDATRTIDGSFSLYPNHVRIVQCAMKLGFQVLPCIIWRKQTNAPNKFMGSGMLPAGAYVTLEHEYILIFRKGGKRQFTDEAEKQRRRRSAIFWEERNSWFSDVWFDLKGTGQVLNDKQARNRSGAYPFELAYRLINMYSVEKDIVLDPFFGIGTTMLAAMCAGRNSIGFEVDASLSDTISKSLKRAVDFSNNRILQRVRDHMAFIKTRLENNRPVKYENIFHNLPVVTLQEREILFQKLKAIETLRDHQFEIQYLEESRATDSR